MELLHCTERDLNKKDSNSTADTDTKFKAKHKQINLIDQNSGFIERIIDKPPAQKSAKRKVSQKNTDNKMG